jgi:probable F420-dependent oxidoreductase
MEIGIYANTHGQGYRDETDMYLADTPFSEMRPVRTAQLAEKNGFHSVWYPDHVCMPIQSGSAHTANVSGQRAYQPHHNMLDMAVVMGAVAACTQRIKLGTSVLIAPYRHPLSDARQFATVDLLSQGRLMLGVGSGWMAEEFTAVEQDHAVRNAQTDECLQIYKRSWEDEKVEFDGEYYKFEDISMDPKPVQKPHPPIVFAGNTPVGARRAIRLCDGLYPLFLDTHCEADRFAPLQDIIRKEADKLDKDVTQFHMMAAATARATDASDPDAQKAKRPTCTGTPEQILEHLQQFADAGFSMVVCMMMCPSGTLAEQHEQIQRFGEEIIPQAKGIKPKGEWKLVD